MDNLLPRCHACGNAFAHPLFIGLEDEKPERIPVCPNCRTPLPATGVRFDPMWTDKDTGQSE